MSPRPIPSQELVSPSQQRSIASLVEAVPLDHLATDAAVHGYLAIHDGSDWHISPITVASAVHAVATLDVPTGTSAIGVVTYAVTRPADDLTAPQVPVVVAWFVSAANGSASALVHSDGRVVWTADPPGRLCDAGTQALRRVAQRSAPKAEFCATTFGEQPLHFDA